MKNKSAKESLTKVAGKLPWWQKRLKKQAEKACVAFQGVLLHEPATTISNCISDQVSLDGVNRAVQALWGKESGGRKRLKWPETKGDASKAIAAAEHTVKVLFSWGPEREEDWPRLLVARLLARGVHYAMIQRSDALAGFDH